MQEKVLVFPEEVLTQSLSFTDMQDLLENGFVNDANSVKAAFNTVLYPAHLLYLDRDKAEDDPRFKQVIPYCILKDGDNIFRYQRTKKGGEARLHGQWSIGVGGHINPCDEGGALQDTYLTALQRELQEEVALEGTHRMCNLGCIYDASTPVGRVHFGIVHLLELDPGYRLHPSDPALAEGQFMPLAYLKNHIGDFEAWSRIVLENLL